MISQISSSGSSKKQQSLLEQLSKTQWHFNPNIFQSNSQAIEQENYQNHQIQKNEKKSWFKSSNNGNKIVPNLILTQMSVQGSNISDQLRIKQHKCTFMLTRNERFARQFCECYKYKNQECITKSCHNQCIMLKINLLQQNEQQQQEQMIPRQKTHRCKCHFNECLKTQYCACLRNRQRCSIQCGCVDCQNDQNYNLHRYKRQNKLRTSHLSVQEYLVGMQQQYKVPQLQIMAFDFGLSQSTKQYYPNQDTNQMSVQIIEQEK